MRQTNSLRAPLFRRLRFQLGVMFLPEDAKAALEVGMEVLIAQGAINRMAVAEATGDVGEEDQMRTLLKDLGVRPMESEGDEEWEL